MTALIVEDELLISLVYKQVLEKNKHQVIAIVSNTTDASIELEKHNPDVIILDIFLKGTQNGIEWTRKIREYNNTPVIFTTGNSLQKTIEETKDITNCLVLCKPIETDTLLFQLEKMTKKS